MEIREITIEHPHAPFDGFGVWFVFEMRYRKAQLLHPVTFTELILAEYEFVRSRGKSLWPVNTSGTTFDLGKFIKRLEERIESCVKSRRSFPIQLVAKALAELKDISHEDALFQIGEIGKTSNVMWDDNPEILLNKGSREYRINPDADISGIQGRPLTILQILQENGSASIYQLTHLATGRLKTVSGVSRVVTYFVNKMTSQGILEIVG